MTRLYEKTQILLMRVIRDMAVYFKLFKLFKLQIRIINIVIEYFADDAV